MRYQGRDILTLLYNSGEPVLLKLIIADDEYRVCQLIENILPWEEYGITLAGTAHNGMDAFQLINDIRPDIVVTDIRMPGYDGLSLIEKSRDVDPDISFIIISGYRDFEYAQRALKFGAEDYLLKPVSRDDLEQIISKVIKKKNRNQEINRRENSLQKEVRRSREIMKKQLASHFIDKGCHIEPYELSNLEKNYSVSFQGSHFQVLIFQIDHSKSDQAIESTKAVDTILVKTEQSINHYLVDHVNEQLCDHRDLSLIYILNVKSGCGLSQRDFESLHECASRKASEYGKWRITLCPGKAVSAIDELSESYDEAKWISRDRILRGCGRILEKREVPPVEDEISQFDISTLEERIRATVESGGASDMRKIFAGDFFPSGSIRRVQNPDTLVWFYRFAVESFKEQFRLLGADNSSLGELGDKAEKTLLRSGSIERLASELSGFHMAILDDLRASRRLKAYKPIRVAKEYIDMHYAENIDLNLIAREAGFNPVYFSSLFKKETGINFKEYLLQRRIERAKELLISGNETIAVVSEKVGYRDVRYFSRIFSKTVGIKPNMYRKIYG